MRILILGGTAQARELATGLRSRNEYRIIFSLAGRTHEPALPDLPRGQLRVGGFGGVEGLRGYLRAESIDVLIDATHPFARVMSAHAVDAARTAGVRLLALRRPAWTAQPGDRWTHVPDVKTAAEHVAALADGRCVFVTTGRMELAAYAGDERHAYLIRAVTAPDGPLPPRHTVVLDRGPYSIEAEAQLMAHHDVGALVTKNSGGSATAAKLTAARRRGIPVTMVDPPAPAPGVETAATTADVLRLLELPAAKSPDGTDHADHADGTDRADSTDGADN
ncbi:cobalt-precorrin-6A reductase [Catenulispora pinisilvae]|uniref:cobalt-precorrin-6A reductase n=1 Tax=Catenulispora pinisilvae TaxID=2705253 RepID=UPI001891C5FC|nr:cobalt-precorrin-6A reductase [Catenulispora pinisilvae]